MPKKTNKSHLKDKAYDLFINTEMTQKGIATFLDVSEKTISQWANPEDEPSWEEIKGASSITSGRIISKLYKKLDELADADRLDTDALIKTARTIESLSDRKATLSQTINVFKGFTTFAFSKNSELAKQINQLQMEYIREQASKS